MIEFEGLIRIGAFVGIFGAVALWELAAPRRRQTFDRGIRWPHNLGLLLVDVILLRMVAPGAAIAVAVTAQTGGWGLLNVIGVPAWAAIVLGVILLDLAIYFQHVMFHAVPVLWRLHRVHHADLDFDVTTGIRFHPIEILISTAIKCAAVAAIGAPALSVLVFEVLLNGTSVFNHANASIPERFECWLRWLVVTPDVHRIHHSIQYDESSSNFGFNLPWWDRLFGTYEAQPRAGHATMSIGVDSFRSARDLRLDQLLVQPFRDSPGQYPITRRQVAG
jgi:sterol desaturase/sphingolipid hydroxylase (fatty acid hydroxylase superfamily)